MNMNLIIKTVKGWLYVNLNQPDRVEEWLRERSELDW